METDKKSTDVTHYVIFSEKLGIYLGNGKWSFVNNGEGKKEAVCVPKSIAMRILKKVAEQSGTAMIKEVYPDGPMSASEQACVNAGLPYWNPQLYKGESK